MTPDYLRRPQGAWRRPSGGQKIIDMNMLRDKAAATYGRVYKQTGSEHMADAAAKRVLGPSVYRRAKELGHWPYYEDGDTPKKIVGSIRRAKEVRHLIDTGVSAMALYKSLDREKLEKRVQLNTPWDATYKTSIKHIPSCDLYTIYLSGQAPCRCIGLYTTRAAAVRVARIISRYDSVGEYVCSLYADTTDEPYTQPNFHWRNSLKINEPIAKPKENVSYHAESGRLKIKTPENQGYTDVCANIYRAYELRTAILCAGDLNPYIKVEQL